MTQAPLFWLQQIEEAVQATHEIPLWGFPPPFPWEECSDHIATCLQLEGLRLSHRETHFLQADALTAGLGAQPVLAKIELTPLTDAAYWLMAAEDVAKLTQLLLMPENAMKGWASGQFQEGFYRYLLLSCLEQIDKLKPFSDLSPKLAAATSLPNKSALCIDVQMTHPKLTLWGRLVCPEDFHHHFKQHFSAHAPSILSSPLVQQVVLSLPLEIGHTQIHATQWEKRAVGDLLILDRCSYDPQTHKGTASMMLNAHPLFRVKIRENNLKVIDYAFYSEDISMSDDYSVDDPNNDTFQEDDFKGEDAENHLWAPSNGEPSIEEQLSTQPLILTLSVEVAKIQMPLEKLLQLKPGNTLELPVHPEAGVNLVMNGKKVAKGELIKWGDMLGIKILKLH